MRGRKCPSANVRDRIVPRKFGAVAKLLWTKPAAEIAHIAGVDERTGKRILRGETDVPATVALAALLEMLRPLKEGEEKPNPTSRRQSKLGVSPPGSTAGDAAGQ
jgi:hypothetical protein